MLVPLTAIAIGLPMVSRRRNRLESVATRLAMPPARDWPGSISLTSASMFFKSAPPMNAPGLPEAITAPLIAGSLAIRSSAAPISAKKAGVMIFIDAPATSMVSSATPSSPSVKWIASAIFTVLFQNRRPSY